MGKEIKQDQTATQEVNFNNGQGKEFCDYKLLDVPIIISNGRVTQVICRFLTRDTRNKCLHEGNKGNDCYLYPPRHSPAAFRGKGISSDYGD